MASPLTRARKLLAERPDLAERVLLLADRAAPHVVTTPEAAHAVVFPFLAGQEVEHLVCVVLDRRRQVIEAGVLTIGSDGFCIVDPRQIFRWALTRKRAASVIILAHNHPSGDPTPSPQDREVTRRVEAAGRAIGIPLLDHLVVADERFVSLATEGEIRSVHVDVMYCNEVK